MLSIAGFTGSRSEYGLLKTLFKAFHSAPDINFQLIVGGSHLSKVHGSTLSEIESDGLTPSFLLPLSIDSAAEPSMAFACSEAMQGASDIFRKYQPDLLFLLGDRYETFAVAAAAHLNNIPIVHIHKLSS